MGLTGQIDNGQIFAGCRVLSFQQSKAPLWGKPSLALCGSGASKLYARGSMMKAGTWAKLASGSHSQDRMICLMNKYSMRFWNSVTKKKLHSYYERKQNSSWIIFRGFYRVAMWVEGRCTKRRTLTPEAVWLPPRHCNILVKGIVQVFWNGVVWSTELLLCKCITYARRQSLRNSSVL